ncbi:hypothetical protein NBRC110019_30830 [Neptunitalea chrysea]|uniref:Uncharacterized protein n=1 Tax=Neptunitalea chrysea TaxID=1647581 RepID=A0A9W6B920_9FLAO|nr:hypothetical protein [Neptunitalea chrysea]GLB54042.1 hypothetical protein NBRC110019_30830 [Neptunitalea chrysea]
MKKLFLASAIVASLCFVGCSSDDDSGEGGTSGTDCFDCTLAGMSTEFCYTDGDDTYTITVMGVETEQSLGGLDWEDVKEGLQATCE